MAGNIVLSLNKLPVKYDLCGFGSAILNADQLDIIESANHYYTIMYIMCSLREGNMDLKIKNIYSCFLAFYCLKMFLRGLESDKSSVQSGDPSLSNCASSLLEQCFVY